MTTILYRTTPDEFWGLISSEITSKITDDGKEILERSVRNSAEIWVAFNDEVVLGFWGLIAPTLLSNEAYIWFYSNPNLAEYSFVFIRHSIRALENALKSYPTIVGHCHREAYKSQRWLRWLGAEFGNRDGDVIPFEIRETKWQRQLAQ